ncbi:MAG TPA: hypothetical protein VGM75_20545 [Pseudonocardiaceae bacterium]
MAARTWADVVHVVLNGLNRPGHHRGEVLGQQVRRRLERRQRIQVAVLQFLIEITGQRGARGFKS